LNGEARLLRHRLRIAQTLKKENAKQQDGHSAWTNQKKSSWPATAA
jgi:hypothetical protein